MGEHYTYDIAPYTYINGKYVRAVWDAARNAWVFPEPRKD